MKTRICLFLALCSLIILMGWPAAASQEPMVQSAGIILAGDDFNAGTFENTILSAGGLTLAPEANDGQYLSAALDTPLAFNALMPQWLADVPDNAGMVISVRTGTGGDVWSDWVQLQPDADLTLPGDETLTGSIITVPAVDGKHRQVQFSITFSRQAGEPAPVLQQVFLHLVDSTQGPSSAELVSRQQALDAQRPVVPQAGYPKPPVVSRKVWCTDPQCNYNDGLEYVPVSHLVVHHTVTGGSGDSADIVRAIWRFHSFDRGWGDIGYNYLIDPNGVIYEGHLGGDDVVGTHAAGANYGSMGVSLIGTYTSVTPSQAMQTSLAKLLAWKADQKNINVFSAGRVPQLGSNVSWGLPFLGGHRDVHGYPSTVCPGDAAFALLPGLRRDVANRIGFVSPHAYIDEFSNNFVKSQAGSWYPVNNNDLGGCGFDGHAYYTWSTTDQNNSTNWGEWNISVNVCGVYQIESYAPYCLTSRAETAGARYTVTDSTGPKNVTVSHQANVGTWMSLGNFAFSAGNSGKVRLTDLTTTDSGLGVWFDAIRLRLLNPLPAPAASSPSPGNQAWLGSRTVTFNWAVSNAAYVKNTRLDVATDSQFANTILSKTFNGVKTTHTDTFNQDYDRLYWRVVLTALCNQVSQSPVWRFGIDTLPPSSIVHAVYEHDDGHFTVAWSSSDGGSGAATYDIQFRTGPEVAWNTWLNDSPATAASFAPAAPYYQFRSLATDRVGNSEVKASAVFDISSEDAIRIHRVIMLPVVRHSN